MKKRSLATEHLHAATLRVAKFHYLFVLLYAGQSIAFHASKLITPELLLKRWLAVAGLAVAAVIAWFVGRQRHAAEGMYQTALVLLIAADLAFAVFNVYTQRGYASKSVLLFMIPILVAAALRSRTALFGTAILAIIAYSTTVITYFVKNFNEGYMAEMYAELGLYSGLFLGTAWILWAVTRKS